MDVEWSDRIHEACLAANTHLKTATKTTPFRLMFGRDFNPANLFRASNIEFDEQHSSSEDGTIVELEVNEDIYDPPVNSNEWIKDMDLSRTSECQDARTNIVQGQARQKQIFDAKVQRNRYFDLHLRGSYRS